MRLARSACIRRESTTVSFLSLHVVVQALSQLLDDQVSLIELKLHLICALEESLLVNWVGGALFDHILDDRSQTEALFVVDLDLLLEFLGMRIFDVFPENF